VALKSNGTLWAWGNNWAGSIGNGTTNSASAPVQVGSGTNWVKIWAGILETVGMQSDGSLWYWGENPNPAFAQGAGQIVSPMRVTADTNWTDVGFGVNTVFAIQSDGTLWTWGRQADRYTGATNTGQDAIPTRIGTNTDWRSLCATTGWWCNGLTKKDGSLWFMDASEGKPNGPRQPYEPVQVRPIHFDKDCVAYAAGATHAAAPGVHGPIGVILTSDGEVWTWGMILGDPPTLRGSWAMIAARIEAQIFPQRNITIPGPPPVYKIQPWLLRNSGD
jgi:hypothetical protein